MPAKCADLPETVGRHCRLTTGSQDLLPLPRGSQSHARVPPMAARPVLAPGHVATDEFLASGWSFLPRSAPAIPLPAPGAQTRADCGSARHLFATPITIEEAP
jgi:hypothetical protein